MADRSPASLRTEARLECTSCGARIELCAFCESAECSYPICYRCLRRELRQSLTQPHVHGG